MDANPSELSLAAIERLLGRAEPPREWIERLAGDPRLGVRRLALRLLRRAERARAEEERLDGLLALERALWARGVERVAGVDEAGMGPLAGPIVACALVFPPGARLAGVADSKVLEAPQRERLALEIRARAAVGLGRVEAGEIDALGNVHQAGLLAMRRALDALPERPQHVLLDARILPELDLPQEAFEKGETRSFSIAAASIVAKVERDALMLELDRAYPAYGFAVHKGYCTARHEEALRRHGPSPVHRLSYGALREIQGGASARFYALRERVAAVGEPALLDALAEEVRGAPELEPAERKKLCALLSRRRRAAQEKGAPSPRPGGAGRRRIGSTESR